MGSENWNTSPGMVAVKRVDHWIKSAEDWMVKGNPGRTPMVQGGGNDGRDHHPNCFTMWLAGGGVKAGTTLGDSDGFGFNASTD